MHTPSATPMLSEQDFYVLDELLEEAEPENAMLVEEFDGFCVAAATSPLAVSEETVLQEALGTPLAEALARMGADRQQQLLNLLERHFRSVRRRLAENDEFEAVIGRNESGRLIAEPWAIGYLRGLNLRPEGWDPVDDDEICAEALGLVLRFAGADNPDAVEAEPIDEDDWEELVDEMIEGVLEMYDRLAPAREQALKPSSFRHESKPPGRNDTCSCGSGRKFKHCHGR
jgi:uncharacterized protein